MCRQYACWLGGAFALAVWLESCGAVTIEPAIPDEPVATAPVVPRLMRRDGGIEAVEGGGAPEEEVH